MVRHPSQPTGQGQAAHRRNQNARCEQGQHDAPGQTPRSKAGPARQGVETEDKDQGGSNEREEDGSRGEAHWVSSPCRASSQARLNTTCFMPRRFQV